MSSITDGCDVLGKFGSRFQINIGPGGIEKDLSRDLSEKDDRR